MPFQTLRRRQRIWDDLDEEIREEYGWGKSLRWLKACVDAKLGGSVGLRTLTESAHARTGETGSPLAGRSTETRAPGGTRGRFVGHIDV